MPVISKTQLENASLDSVSLADFANGSNATTIITRLGQSYPSIAKFLFDNQTNINNALAPTLAASLATTNDAAKNSGQVGFNGQLNYVALTIGWADKLNAVKPEWWTATGSTDAAALQAAINAACTARRVVLVNNLCDIGTTTISFPSNTDGCTLMGANRNSHIKYSGTGAAISGTSSRNLTIRNLTITGPFSTVAGTRALDFKTSNSAVGVYYGIFADLTIEGFETSFDVDGFTHCCFSNISIGLSKSGKFTGTDVQATPLIGMKLGTTVLACQFNFLTIFSRQRCIASSTGAQLSEGHYHFNCTYDLSFNDGHNANQACVYYESIQDLSFIGTWMTNTQKYGSQTGPFSDQLLHFNHVPTGINAPFTKVKLIGCTLVGNTITVNMGANPDLTRGFVFNANQFDLWVNLGGFNVTGNIDGLSICGNEFNVTGDAATHLGLPHYDLVGRILDVNGARSVIVDNNIVHSSLPLRNVPSYFRFQNCIGGHAYDNHCPPQVSLSSGSDVIAGTSNTNFTTRGYQQGSGRVFTPASAIANGTYSATGTSVIGTIATGLTKARMALISVYIDVAQVSNPGGTTMRIELVGCSSPLRFFRTTATGNQTIRFQVMGLVSGNVELKIVESMQIILDSTAQYKEFELVFI